MGSHRRFVELLLLLKQTFTLDTFIIKFAVTNTYKMHVVMFMHAQQYVCVCVIVLSTPVNLSSSDDSTDEPERKRKKKKSKKRGTERKRSVSSESGYCDARVYI